MSKQAKKTEEIQDLSKKNRINLRLNDKTLSQISELQSVLTSQFGSPFKMTQSIEFAVNFTINHFNKIKKTKKMI